MAFVKVTIIGCIFLTAVVIIIFQNIMLLLLY